MDELLRNINYVDYILLIVIALFVLHGLRAGFVRIIGGFLGIILGAWAAGTFYGSVTTFLVDHTSIELIPSLLISFVLIFIVTNVIVRALVNILTSLFKIIPLATTLNRILGGALGFIEAVVFIGLFVWIITLVPFQTQFVNSMRQSVIANFFIVSARAVQPLLPRDLREADFQTLWKFSETKFDRERYLDSLAPNLRNRAQDQLEQIENTNN